MASNDTSLSLKQKIKRLLFGKYIDRINELDKELAPWRVKFYQPGHYYSPYPDLKEIESKSALIFNSQLKEIPGIDLHDEEQFARLQQYQKYYGQLKFPVEPETGYRYYFNNDFFSYSDATFLFCTIMHFKPKRIIEIGSGFSSALMIDVNEKYLDNSMSLTFVEPYPEERLNKLINKADNVKIVKDFVQNLGKDFFMQLEENDILFIDSSHVSKTYSDVNYLLFEILPILKKGVVIHIHDIFFPFEYPKEWIFAHRAWTETYLLRAFLQFNKAFSIGIFPSYLEKKYKSWMETNMPLTLKLHQKSKDKNGQEYFVNIYGQSIYLIKNE